MENERVLTSTHIQGLHSLAEITTTDASGLSDMEGLKKLWDELIVSLGLQKVGEVYHSFESGGFTAVVCLTESHMSIHTWPEFSYATVDVFLSNYLRVNDGKAETILRETIEFFGSSETSVHQLKR